MAIIPTAPAINRPYSHVNADLTARHEWNRNGGYCGETSVIIAGLHYGQYLSQFDMREIASPGMPQNSQSYPGVKLSPDAYYNAQLLLGQNANRAIDAVKLNCSANKIGDSMKFLKWVKKNVLKGYPVIIGVFNNVNLLGEPGPGDSQYDHIVTVVGYGSSKPLSTHGGVLDDDVIMIMDNGLYTPNGNNKIPFFYQFTIRDFLKNRTQANNPNGQIYSLLSLPKYQGVGKNNLKYNFGVVITGVLDPNKETLPVVVKDSRGSENPRMGPDGSQRPPAEDIVLTITVSGLKPGINYNLYYYKDEKAVPSSGFNRNSGNPWKSFSVKSGNSKTFTLKTKSSSKAFFRAVPA